MRVSIVVGGRWHAFDLAAQLHQRGALHRIITNYPAFFVRRWGIPETHVASLPLTYIAGRMVRSMPPGFARKTQFMLHRGFAASAARLLDGSDLVHCWSSFAEPSLAWASKRGLPCVLERGSSHISEQRELLREEFGLHGMRWDETHPEVERMELREYEACDEIFVPSRFVERSFMARKFPSHRIFRNSLGVDLSRFRPPLVAPSPPRVGDFRVMYAGSLSLRKGTPYLLEAFGQARQPGWELTLAGGQQHEIRRWFNPVPAGVRLLGHRPQAELAQLYARAHCFVMPSIEEGMAMVQMQALACGLPLICTTNTGGEDLLRMNGDPGSERPHGVTEFPAGYLVPIRSPEAVAWSMRQLSEDGDLWKAKRESSLALASKELSWSRYADRAVHRYRELCSPA